MLMDRYGHVKKMADAEAEGVREAGYEVDMYQYAPPFSCTVIDNAEFPRLFPRIS
jgi:multimeric flavodoxin WrbA